MLKVINVKDKGDGNRKAHDVLSQIVDPTTFLALSGGTSVDYKTMLVNPSDITCGAVGIVDERYGEEFHRDSNELLLKEAGVVDWCSEKVIEFYKILCGLGFVETANAYEETIKEQFARFTKKVGVMGVGANLHTGGIFPYSAAAKSPDLVVAETVDDKFPRRLSLTLKALGEFNAFVILMFGETKKEAVKTLLDDLQNDMQKFPAIFYRKGFADSFLITDQEV